MGMLDRQRHLLPSHPCVTAISCGPGVSKDLLTIAGQISVTIDERNLDSSIQCKAQIDQSFVANTETEQGKGFHDCPAGWSEIERHTESSLDVKLVQIALLHNTMLHGPHAIHNQRLSGQPRNQDVADPLVYSEAFREIPRYYHDNW